MICSCSSCTKNPDVDPVTKSVLDGRNISASEHREHATAEARRRTLNRRLETTSPAPSHIGTRGCPPQLKPRAISGPGAGSSLKPKSHKDPVAPTNYAALDAQLNGLLSALDQADKLEKVVQDQSIVFRIPPTAHSPSVEEIAGDFDRLCALDPTASSSAVLHRYEVQIQHILDFLARQDEKHIRDAEFGFRCAITRSQMEERQDRLRQLKSKAWEAQRQLVRSDKAQVVDTTTYHKHPTREIEPITLACYLLVATLHLICGISHDRCTFILETLRLIVQLCLVSADRFNIQNTVNSIRSDIRTVIDILPLQVIWTAYACCPQCYALYEMDACPERCINEDLDNVPCGAKLLKSRRHWTGDTKVPAREFLYQNMQDWVGWLYSRSDLVDYLDRNPTASKGDDLCDIWDASGLRKFLGPDGSKPFYKRPGQEGRLIFSLNMDGFNPFGNKEAGKKVSVGGIYMICLNLPPSVRYDVENMYLVGIIPGPQEPSTHEINHLLKPLINDLLVFWNDGVYYSRTVGFPGGRLVRCAVVPLVCDLPASRQMSGSPHYKAKHFCAFCHQHKDDINDLDYKNWRACTNVDHRAAAEGWLQSQSQKDREAHYKMNGIRWSELLRLPYWDPIRFNVIDSMHAFYLRMFAHHCRSIWGMDINFEDGDGILFDRDPNHPTEAEMQIAHQVLEFGSNEALKDLRVAIVRQLCRETSTLEFRGRKGLLLQRLLEYRERQGWFDSAGNPISHIQKFSLETSKTRNSRPPVAGSMELSGVFQLDAITDHEALELFRTATKTAIKNMKKIDLLRLVALHVQKTSLMSAEKMSVAELRHLIQNERIAVGIIDDKEKVIAGKKGGTRVLGCGVLKEIREDMLRLELPSWSAAAPAHPGEAKWGKFGADQWRAFCLINLPVTLIRLWGNFDADSREHKMLVNFMHLVTAVKLATMRKMTKDRISQYESHMHQYLTSLQSLYPEKDLTPYQHLSLHFGPLLRRFGPTHAWRCFPFERYNYLMQQIPTNNHFGELEKTLFMQFTKGQRLRALYHIESTPSSIHELIRIYEKVFKSDIRGTHLDDVLSFNEDFKEMEEKVTWCRDELVKLSDTSYDLLKKWMKINDTSMRDQILVNTVFQRSKLTRLGQTFQTLTGSGINSQIIFSTSSGDWSAGSITQIFSHTRRRATGGEVTQTFFVVNPYAPLSPKDSKKDCYRTFPVAGGRLFYDMVCETGPILLSVDAVKSHFALCRFAIAEIEKDCILALPLDKE